MMHSERPGGPAKAVAEVENPQKHKAHLLLRIAGRIARPPGKALRRNLDPVL